MSTVNTNISIDPRHFKAILELLACASEQCDVVGDNRAFDHKAVEDVALRSKGLLKRIQDDYYETMPPPWANGEK